LTFFFSPSQRQVTYTGRTRPLRGATMSDAYRSVVDISFKIRAGLVMRQIHHWAALVFLAAIVVHLARVFFTGAFRRPREINWVVGVTLLLLAMGKRFHRLLPPDDLLSGTGLRIMFSIVLSIPLIGSWLAFLIFGGRYPGTAITERLFVVHVLFFPVLIAGLLGAHLAILWHQKHTDFRVRARPRRPSTAAASGPSTRPSRWGCSARGGRPGRPRRLGLRSTPSGSMVPTPPPRCRLAPSPTGISAGSTEPFGSCPISRSGSGTTPSPIRSSREC